MTAAAAATASGMPHGFSEMLHGFARLLETGQGSDMTITCKGKVFKVHSAIIASRSDFFATVCWGGFKEADNHCINLPDDDPAAVEAMLQYLYTLNHTIDAHNCMYDNEEGRLLMGSDKELGQEPFPELVFDIYMYRMADKYGIHGLKDLSSETFAFTLEVYTKPISARALTSLIRLVYDSTPEPDEGLRRPVLAYAKHHLKDLLSLEDFKTMLVDVPEFTYQLLVQEVDGRVK